MTFFKGLISPNLNFFPIVFPIFLIHLPIKEKSIQKCHQMSQWPREGLKVSHIISQKGKCLI